MRSLRAPAKEDGLASVLHSSLSRAAPAVRRSAGHTRSMRGETRRLLFDRLRRRGLLGRALDLRLLPLDRLRLADQRMCEHLVHARDRNDLEPALPAVGAFAE